MTKFKLLIRKDSDEAGVWREWHEEEANGPKAAMRAAYMRHPDGEIVAIVAPPVRSWKPEPIRTEKVPDKLIIGEPQPGPATPGTPPTHGVPAPETTP